MSTKNIPLLVVPGMPRSGTTFLYHYLQRHPQVFVPFRKEVDYFNNHCRFKGEEWFRRLYRERKEGQIGGDFSPNCWFDPNSAKWISEFDPDAKVVLCLRDPAEFAVSLYTQKGHSEYDLPEDVVDFAANGYHCNLSEKGGEVFFDFTDGIYLENVKKFAETFGENLLVYDFSWFRKNQLEALKLVESFLGVESYFTEENFDNLRINASQRMNVRFLYHLTQKEWFRDFFEAYVPRKVSLFLRGWFDKLSVIKNPGKDAKNTHDVDLVERLRSRQEVSTQQYRDLFRDRHFFYGNDLGVGD